MLTTKKEKLLPTWGECNDMELKYSEYVDLSKFTVDKRKQLFPSKYFDNNKYCIVFRNSYGYFVMQFACVANYKQALKELKDDRFEEVNAGCNNLGEM